MSVLFVPDYTDGNPYQSNLAAALDEEVTYGRQEARLPVVATLRRDDVSVVHVHWLNLYFKGETRRETAVNLGLLAVRLLAMWLAGVAVVWTVHNVTTHEPEQPRLERWFKRWFVTSGPCDRLVVHCESAQESLVEEFDLPPDVRERIDVIPHGHYLDNYENELTGAETRASLDIPPSETVFLFFGLIRRYKGVLDLIETFQDGTFPDSRLLVAGNPATETLRTELLERTATDDRIHTAYEFVPDDEIQRYMNAADAVVLPFRDSTTSGSAILAMSFGKALVVPRVGCLPELLDGDGAVLYDNERDGALRRSLETATERNLAEMGAYNREQVSQYDWEGIAAKTSQTYASARRDDDERLSRTAG